jgi:metal-responsive CopG/Arc/MetJ family transcriptional regulator
MKIDVSEQSVEELDRIKREEGHSSRDSVIKTLLLIYEQHKKE